MCLCRFVQSTPHVSAASVYLHAKPAALQCAPPLQKFLGTECRGLAPPRALHSQHDDTTTHAQYARRPALPRRPAAVEYSAPFGRMLPPQVGLHRPRAPGSLFPSPPTVITLTIHMQWRRILSVRPPLPGDAYSRCRARRGPLVRGLAAPRRHHRSPQDDSHLLCVCCSRARERFFSTATPQRRRRVQPGTRVHALRAEPRHDGTLLRLSRCAQSPPRCPRGAGRRASAALAAGPPHLYNDRRGGPTFGVFASGARVPSWRA